MSSLLDSQVLLGWVSLFLADVDVKRNQTRAESVYQRSAGRNRISPQLKRGDTNTPKSLMQSKLESRVYLLAEISLI